MGDILLVVYARQKFLMDRESYPPRSAREGEYAMGLELDSLRKALASLDSALRLHAEKHGESRELELALRDSVVQRFEYTYEMCWKFMQRWLTDNVGPELAQPLYSRKELFRLAARRGLIADPQPWFIFGEARNVSAHTYNETNAAQAFQAAVALAGEARDFLVRLQQVND